MSSYCGLTDSRMSASDTDLPVSTNNWLECRNDSITLVFQDRSNYKNKHAKC